MTAVGGPDVLQLAELPEPAIASARDVRVRVLAAGINSVDFHWMPAPAVFGWPEDQAAAAHRALEAGQVTGKAVLTMA